MTNQSNACLAGTSLVPAYMWLAQCLSARSDDTTPEHYLSLNHATPPEVLSSLCRVKDPTLELQLAYHPSLAPRDLSRLAQHVGSGSLRVLELVAARTDTPPATLARLVRTYAGNRPSRRELTRRLAGNTSTPPNVIAELLALKSAAFVAAANPSLPESAFAGLARRWSLHVPLARNPSTPPWLLEKLLKSNQPGVRAACAWNPSVSQDALAKLAARSFELELSVLTNPSCPSELIDRVLRLADTLFLSHLAGNPALSSEVLLELSTSSDSGILETLLLNPATPTEILSLVLRKATSHRALSLAVQHPNADADLLRWVVQYAQSGVCVLALAHPNISAESAMSVEFDLFSIPGANTASLPALPAGMVADMVALSRNWSGTLGELMSASQLIAA